MNPWFYRSSDFLGMYFCNFFENLKTKISIVENIFSYWYSWQITSCCSIILRKITRSALLSNSWCIVYGLFDLEISHYLIFAIRIFIDVSSVPAPDSPFTYSNRIRWGKKACFWVCIAPIVPQIFGTISKNWENSAFCFQNVYYWSVFQFIRKTGIRINLFYVWSEAPISRGEWKGRNLLCWKHFARNSMKVYLLRLRYSPIFWCVFRVSQFHPKILKTVFAKIPKDIHFLSCNSYF